MLRLNTQLDVKWHWKKKEKIVADNIINQNKNDHNNLSFIQQVKNMWVSASYICQIYIGYNDEQGRHISTIRVEYRRLNLREVKVLVRVDDCFLEEVVYDP